MIVAGKKAVQIIAENKLSFSQKIKVYLKVTALHVTPEEKDGYRNIVRKLFLAVYINFRI